MSNEWDEYADAWDTDSSVQEYANNAFGELAKVISLNGLSVFDFGCGTGSLAQLLSPRVEKIVALDASSEMIGRLLNKKLSNVSAITGVLSKDLIDSQPHLIRKFDLIVASSVCGFLQNYEETLGLLKLLLKNGGVFVQWDWLSSNDSSEMGLSEMRVTNALNENGFLDVQVTSPFEMHNSRGTMPVLMAIGKNA